VLAPPAAGGDEELETEALLELLDEPAVDVDAMLVGARDDAGPPALDDALEAGMTVEPSGGADGIAEVLFDAAVLEGAGAGGALAGALVGPVAELARALLDLAAGIELEDELLAPAAGGVLVVELTVTVADTKLVTVE
jgi:hypothetical protein